MKEIRRLKATQQDFEQRWIEMKGLLLNSFPAGSLRPIDEGDDETVCKIEATPLRKLVDDPAWHFNIRVRDGALDAVLIVSEMRSCIRFEYIAARGGGGIDFALHIVGEYLSKSQGKPIFSEVAVKAHRTVVAGHKMAGAKVLMDSGEPIIWRLPGSDMPFYLVLLTGEDFLNYVSSGNAPPYPQVDADLYRNEILEMESLFS